MDILSAEYSVLLQDASRLVDLCRQCIVFENLHDLAACLRIIRTDPDIRVKRAKNRLAASYDAGVSAGYRDIVLNVQLKSDAAVSLGVDEHVCEVQLLHRLFAELKVPPVLCPCMPVSLSWCANLQNPCIFPCSLLPSMFLNGWCPTRRGETFRWSVWVTNLSSNPPCSLSQSLLFYRHLPLLSLGLDLAERRGASALCGVPEPARRMKLNENHLSRRFSC